MDKTISYEVTFDSTYDGESNYDISGFISCDFSVNVSINKKLISELTNYNDLVLKFKKFNHTVTLIDILNRSYYDTEYRRILNINIHGFTNKILDNINDIIKCIKLLHLFVISINICNYESDIFVKPNIFCKNLQFKNCPNLKYIFNRSSTMCDTLKVRDCPNLLYISDYMSSEIRSVRCNRLNMSKRHMVISAGMGSHVDVTVFCYNDSKHNRNSRLICYMLAMKYIPRLKKNERRYSIFPDELIMLVAAALGIRLIPCNTYDLTAYDNMLEVSYNRVVSN
jgi:hypothetical protein